MAPSDRAFAPSALQRRLLNDIAEVQQYPYPNIHLHVDDADFRKACLILSTEAYGPLHLLIEFGSDYPLHAPSVTIQSPIVHPNIFGTYICATILNTTEGWTPAYTLKGVLIQLLSFFTSESLEQDHGGGSVNLLGYRRHNALQRYWWENCGSNDYCCNRCGFKPEWVPTQGNNPAAKLPAALPSTVSKLLSLPDEIVLMMLEEMPTKDILVLADAVPVIKRTMTSYGFIRTRELQCFVLKKSYMVAKLGIGISVIGGGKPVLRSEFDLLSQEAFFQHDVRRSVQGVEFQKWLPLPLSRRHWNSVKGNVGACLKGIRSFAKMRSSEPCDIGVLYNLMNNVVVQFSADAEKNFRQPDGRSTLNHASEKAVEAYSATFHLLLCLATEQGEIVQAANKMIARFLQGPRSKKHFPDLGHLLVASLISEQGLTEPLIFAIIKEAILRNVVWMLDTKGANMAELAYLEPSPVSEYRLVKTFEASRTSYRLLMFLKLFSSSARPSNKSLTSIRDELFDNHGIIPGASVNMAHRIREIRDINGFPGFLRAMGIQTLPGKSEFTTFLRRTVTDSVTAGYSVMPLSQSQLYMIRKKDGGRRHQLNECMTRSKKESKTRKAFVAHKAPKDGKDTTVGPSKVLLRLRSEFQSIKSKTKLRRDRLCHELIGSGRKFAGTIIIPSNEAARSDDESRLSDIQTNNGFLGAGLVSYKSGKQQKKAYELGEVSRGNAQDAEMYAIAAALYLAKGSVQKKGTKFKLLRIYTDSQASLLSLQTGKNLCIGPLHHGFFALKEMFDAAEWLVEQGVRVELIWVKGHDKSEGNKMADQQATNAILKQRGPRKQRKAQAQAQASAPKTSPPNLPPVWKNLGQDWATEWVFRAHHGDMASSLNNHTLSNNSFEKATALLTFCTGSDALAKELKSIQDDDDADESLEPARDDNSESEDSELSELDAAATSSHA
ncbi:hypothetical protein E8E13_002503 [Curvularia kusanoi]|uniref:UBC core domain-containing protein n=1 Tax=Curvularia kusanoi TaxID=90978 RepID=A0A9P4T431_CURKU|nr:hypothetical protein E8E13_002503 [Curvularia kusanoi]